MKSLAAALLSLVGLIHSHAAALKLDGDLTYEITEPRLNFRLNGGIQNTSPAGSSSGTIKLVLRAGSFPFPAGGVVIGEYTLGEIGGGYQFADFDVRVPSNVPKVSGKFYFTIIVLEFTGSGWAARLAVPTGERTVIDGNFIDQKRWIVPAAPVASPPAALAEGRKLTLKTLATDELNLLSPEYQVVTEIRIRKGGAARLRGPDGKRAATYRYARGRSKPAGTIVRHGRLRLAVRATSKLPAGESNVMLYFASGSDGFYKSTVTSGAGKETTWGTFTFQ